MTNPKKTIALFKRFVSSGYAQAQFTKPLYHDLSQSFGFIAHFDRRGFYVARFEGWPERVETLAQVTEWTVTRTPFEQGVKAYAEQAGLLDAARLAAARELEAAERAELARLRAKYGEP